MEMHFHCYHSDEKKKKKIPQWKKREKIDFALIEFCDYKFSGFALQNIHLRDADGVNHLFTIRIMFINLNFLYS